MALEVTNTDHVEDFRLEEFKGLRAYDDLSPQQKTYSNYILTIRIELQLTQYSEYTVVSPIVVIFALQVKL